MLLLIIIFLFYRNYTIETRMWSVHIIDIIYWFMNRDNVSLIHNTQSNTLRYCVSFLPIKLGHCRIFWKLIVSYSNRLSYYANFLIEFFASVTWLFFISFVCLFVGFFVWLNWKFNFSHREFHLTQVEPNPNKRQVVIDSFCNGFQYTKLFRSFFL